MNKTKIVCTIGPASEEQDMLEKMIQNGMNVARLNFSHGNHDEHAERIKRIRAASAKTGMAVAIMLDTQGPEIRIGKLADKIKVVEDDIIILTAGDLQGRANALPISYAGLAKDVHPGSALAIDDGLISLEVKEVQNDDIICRVLSNGYIMSRKSINAPGVEVGLPGVTEKDMADIRFAAEQHLDFIAASFVRRAEDIVFIRRFLNELGSDMQIIAKIENQTGVQNIDSILKEADGIMVARGDLGVEIPPEEVPLVQKTIIKKCNLAGKYVITATQMLDSMIHNRRPTRAEASDVANAIVDGTDAIMLSGETAAGLYPLEALQTMSRIAARAETINRSGNEVWETGHIPTITDAICHAAYIVARDLQAKAIVAPTTSGSTARRMAKYRPQAPILAITTSEKVLRQLCLAYGVIPLCQPHLLHSTDDMIDSAISLALEKNLLQKGDITVITAGYPTGSPGTTNLIKVRPV